jgi:uncharacterized protein (UPF0276 family)
VREDGRLAAGGQEELIAVSAVTFGRAGEFRLPARAGIGLRSAHFEVFAAGRPDVAFLEVHTENYFHDGGGETRLLDRLRADYPVSLHGVGLALGSVDPLDRAHVARVVAAARRFEPAEISEHACWGRVDGVHFNDLLPLPFTEEAVLHLASRVRELQDALGRRILVENVSQYVKFRNSTMSEGQFLSALVAEAGCGVLLDVNNLYVNAVNVGFDPVATIDAIPVGAVGEIHLAGHQRRDIEGRSLLLDDHGSRVCESVWALYDHALERFGVVPTLIEWDTNVPSLETLLAEARRADTVLGRRHACAA